MRFLRWLNSLARGRGVAADDYVMVGRYAVPRVMAEDDRYGLARDFLPMTQEEREAYVEDLRKRGFMGEEAAD